MHMRRYKLSARPIQGVRLGAENFPAKEEEHGGEDAASGPKIIQIGFFTDVKDGKRDKNRQGDYFLENFKLPHIHDLVADPVGGDLDEVFEQGDAPTNQGGNHPRAVVKILEVAIPGKSHEDIAAGQQERGHKESVHCGFYTSFLIVHCKADAGAEQWEINHGFSGFGRTPMYYLYRNEALGCKNAGMKRTRKRPHEQRRN